ncbi:GNAT family N-acetyltransferase [Brevibacillus choshinensis]|uniref:GNAT family N-acetyltransferase n=1 Tax=Brevibacillus choshinensis TaxID=54911 RepID=UPI001EEEFAEB|nr:GNAT family N-acetyltransferase [Brevibacillus choshinensis]
MQNTVPNLHELTEQDIPGLIHLSTTVGWDYNEDEIRTILAIGTIYGHKNSDERLVSCAAVIPYDHKLTTIGMVIVHSSCRGMGLGRSLMKACMESVPSDSAIMLIATREGKPLYESLGFTTADTIHKFICKRIAPVDHEQAGESFPTEIMREDDLRAVIELDGLAVGSQRSSFLRTRMKQAKTCLVVNDTEGRIAGYGFAVQGPVNLVIGPIVARNTPMAIHLLRRLSDGHDRQVRIDVPDGQNAFLSYLAANGFEKVSEPPVMITRYSTLPPRSGQYYGIGAQIFG